MASVINCEYPAETRQVLQRTRHHNQIEHARRALVQPPTTPGVRSSTDYDSLFQARTLARRLRQPCFQARMLAHDDVHPVQGPSARFAPGATITHARRAIMDARPA